MQTPKGRRRITVSFTETIHLVGSHTKPVNMEPSSSKDASINHSANQPSDPTTPRRPTPSNLTNIPNLANGNNHNNIDSERMFDYGRPNNHQERYHRQAPCMMPFAVYGFMESQENLRILADLRRFADRLVPGTPASKLAPYDLWLLRRYQKLCRDFPRSQSEREPLPPEVERLLNELSTMDRLAEIVGAIHFEDEAQEIAYEYVPSAVGLDRVFSGRQLAGEIAISTAIRRAFNRSPTLGRTHVNSLVSPPSTPPPATSTGAEPRFGPLTPSPDPQVKAPSIRPPSQPVYDPSFFPTLPQPSQLPSNSTPIRRQRRARDTREERRVGYLRNPYPARSPTRNAPAEANHSSLSFPGSMRTRQPSQHVPGSVLLGSHRPHAARQAPASPNTIRLPPMQVPGEHYDNVGPERYHSVTRSFTPINRRNDKDRRNRSA